ncbi:hypothetical protein Glove_21g264 [Diversispora epigaea]|uniref:Uncharacterized protein n=1 Tax=Diversispora epigaea TaxID=1348612 RepID=A0A397JS51_9GLOM|nr:hypothetical protein Glove_21g264 [Diversispora epigaea]
MSELDNLSDRNEDSSKKKIWKNLPLKIKMSIPLPAKNQYVMQICIYNLQKKISAPTIVKAFYDIVDRCAPENM